MDVDLRLVKYFVAVAQTGNVTRAAERLHVSQPALLRDVAQGRLDLAVVFCAPDGVPDGVELGLVCDAAAVVHLPAEHALASRSALSLAELAGETVLIAGGGESGGFTDRVLRAFAAAGVTPRTAPDPYPDLGLRAVREGIGVAAPLGG